MKKLLALSLLASAFTLGGAISAASANPVNSTAVRVTSTAPAATIQRWRRPGRVRIVTRNMRQGRHIYRVTYRITTFPNGRTSSQIVRREMIR